MVFRYNSKYDWVIDNLKGLDFVSKLQLLQRLVSYLFTLIIIKITKLFSEQATLTFIKMQISLLLSYLISC